MSSKGYDAYGTIAGGDEPGLRPVRQPAPREPDIAERLKTSPVEQLESVRRALRLGRKTTATQQRGGRSSSGSQSRPTTRPRIGPKASTRRRARSRPQGCNRLHRNRNVLSHRPDNTSVSVERKQWASRRSAWKSLSATRPPPTHFPNRNNTMATLPQSNRRSDDESWDQDWRRVLDRLRPPCRRSGVARANPAPAFPAGCRAPGGFHGTDPAGVE